MQDLVDCAGVNRASLYATFDDKRSLFLEALKHYDNAVRQQVLAALEETFKPREAIRQLFRKFASDLPTEGGAHGCFLVNTALELAPHDAEIRRLVSRSQAEIACPRSSGRSGLPRAAAPCVSPFAWKFRL